VNLFSLLKQRIDNPIKIGVIGAGKFSSMFLSQAYRTPGMQVVGIAELDPAIAQNACKLVGWDESATVLADNSGAINDAAAQGKTAITSDSMELIQSEAEVIVEITGSPEAGAEHALAAIQNGKHLVMPNVETDCLVGPLLADKAKQAGVCFSMAYGDQPALILEQIDWARTVGFDVVCAGKGTRYQPIYHYSTPETVWSHFGWDDEMVATGNYNAQMFNSFLDGTKSAIEMCAVANGAGLMPAKTGLAFPPVSLHHLQDVLKPEADGGILPHRGTVECVASEDRYFVPLHDDLRWGVYVVLGASHDYVERCFKEYGMKTDSTGKYTSLYRPYHYIGLELGISVASVCLRNEPTGVSNYFMADVAATAKKDLKPGDILDGEGGFTVFGTLMPAADSLASSAFPLGLSNQAKLVKPVAKGQVLTYTDVDPLSDTAAFKLRKEMEALGTPSSVC
jgi:predicted homoserine dehydrogenase-like protein